MRRAGDRRFVQVLMYAMNEKPLGRRFYWPIYRAAEKHGMTIGVHAGSLYRHAPTSIGWGSYFLEDYVAQSGAFESQVLSLVTEGVFAKHPSLKFVMMESGFMWLPAFLWRANKTWRGVRSEVPWVKKPPADIVRENIRFTIQKQGSGSTFMGASCSAGDSGKPAVRSHWTCTQNRKGRRGSSHRLSDA